MDRGAWVRCRAMEHNFHGPSYTLGIEEELMIVDAEATAWSTRSSRCWRTPRTARSSPSSWSRCSRSRPPRARHRRGRRAAAPLRTRCGARRQERGLTIGSAGTHPFAMWEDQRIVARAALPRAGHRAALRRAPGADLRHARPRRRRRPRQGDPRRQRHARAPAGAAGAERQLAFWRADATGLLSTRTPIFRAFPRVGIPPHYDDWAH